MFTSLAILNQLLKSHAIPIFPIFLFSFLVFTQQVKWHRDTCSSRPEGEKVYPLALVSSIQ